MADESNEFLYAAISDMQDTIRALDAKAAGLLAGLAVPLTQTGDIVDTIKGLLMKTTGVPYGLVVLATGTLCASWLTSFVLGIRVLRPLSNPGDAVRIEGNYRPVPTFYSPALYTVPLYAGILRKVVKSNRSLEEHVRLIPSSPGAVREALCYEHMKIGYTAASKIALFNAAMRVAYASIVPAFLLSMMHIFI